jgi:hypothetical protein
MEVLSDFKYFYNTRSRPSRLGNLSPLPTRHGTDSRDDVRPTGSFQWVGDDSVWVTPATAMS